MSDFYAAGDVNSDAKGSGARANAGKVSFSLLPMHLMAGVSRVFMGGLLKYSSFNWAKGMKWSICFDCVFRHLLKWWYCGEEIDPESGEHHLDHVLANIFMLRHYTKTYTEGDDRPLEASLSFADWMDDLAQTFDEHAYLERNPDIKAIVEARRAAKVEA